MIELRSFLNMVKSLYAIDFDRLPELTFDEHGKAYRHGYWPEFRDDPPRFFIRTDRRQQEAIFREIMKRQQHD